MWEADPLDLDQFDQLKFGDSESLLPIRPFFFVPPLEDKPQDPISHSLKLAELNKRLPFRDLPSIKPLEEISDAEDPRPLQAEQLWTSTLKTGGIHYNKIVSWDRLGEVHRQPQTPTAFLSEQDPLVLAVARQRTQARFDDRLNTFYVSQEEFRQALRMLVIGTSSTLFTWNHVLDKFVQADVPPGQIGRIVIDGTDEVISGSILTRFLTIGTLLRRLEEYIKTLNQSMVKAGPTVHAFAHALSTTLSYLRNQLSQVSASTDSVRPAASWMQYAIYEDMLRALSELYGRSEDVKLESYPSFDPSAIKIISTIYDHLSSHYERHSARDIVAIFAYILDATSKEYLHQVGVSVGFGGQPQRQPLKAEERPEDYYSGLEEGEEQEEDIFFALEQIERDFPAFFPKPLLDILPAAQKSLILLKEAQPDHTLLSSEESTKKRVKWFWTEQQIVSVWAEFEATPPDTKGQDTQPLPDLPSASNYPPEFASFGIFDMEPGVFTWKSVLQSDNRSTSALSDFIQGYPAELPAVTPTLPHLTFLVFRQLLDHCATLSSTLLSIYLSSSGNLNFRMHLELLRSYLLVTAPPFKSRLLQALFSDAGEYEVDDTPHSMSLRSVRRRPSKKVKQSKQPWAVGISSNLLEREIWPPVSGDLSFFLRTVIVDSLNMGKDWDDEEVRKQRHIILEEAIWRIGFAIRDLPTGPGRDKWLNPLYIEALDFLYMDYKPPRPMEVLISHDILHKYQRIFAFILRLLRVESALKSVFRIARASNDPTFQNLPKYRQLFLHFRFIAQSFVASLSSYVFDTAIGGNFDPFLTRLSPKSATSDSERSPDGFMDVFELANAHSNLLDDILSTCLLRTGQRSVSELMRHSLELVLEFCVVVGELERKRMEEYEAAPMIEDIFDKFRGKMGILTKVLKGLIDKGPSSSKWPIDVHVGERRPTGGSLALYHLLLKLDLGDWWSK